MVYAIIAVVTLVVLGGLAWVILKSGGGSGTSSGGSISRGGTIDTNPKKRPKSKSATSTSSSTTQGGQRRNWVIAQDGDISGQTYHMGNRTVTIGRKPTNFIQVGDSEVSRVHCQLRPAGARAELVDMNSSSGTFLDGEKLTPNTPYSLENGAIFKVGNTTFEYQMVGDFEENYGVTTAKATGEKFETSTKLQGGSEWREALLEELNKADGNPRVAAESMGIETEVFMQMMQQADIGSEDV